MQYAVAGQWENHVLNFNENSKKDSNTAIETQQKRVF